MEARGSWCGVHHGDNLHPAADAGAECRCCALDIVSPISFEFPTTRNEQFSRQL